MTKTEMGRSRWLLPILLSSLFIHGGAYVVRPIVTYKSLELGADAALVGIIGATFALAPLIFAIQIGQIVDRGKAKLALVTGAAIMALATLALMLIDTILLIILLMPILGMGHLLVMVGGQTLIANLSPGEKYEKNFGLLTFYASLGHALGPLIGGFLADSGGSSFGASTTENVNANAAFLFALVLFCLGTLSVAFLRFKKVDKRQDEGKTSKPSARSVLAIPSFKSAIFVAGATTAVLDVMLIFLPLLGRELGLSAAEVGVLLAVRGFASMAVRLVLGQMSKALGLRRLLNLGSLVTAVSMLLLAFVEDFWFVALLMVVSGFAMGIGQPATMAWVSRISAQETRGLAISIRLTANRLGQVAMPAAAGIIAGGGVGAVFLLMAALQGFSVAVSTRALKKGD